MKLEEKIFKLEAKSRDFIFASSTRKTKDLHEFLTLLGLNPSKAVSAEQIHGNKVSLVSKKNCGEKILGCDALITGEKQIPLIIRTADCVPIIIFDPTHNAIGMIHAGWKGSIKKISVKTQKSMKEVFDTNIKDCIIAMAPSIGICCYEVDETVIEPLKASFSYWEEVALKKENGKWMLNLQKFNELQLINEGAKKENITISGICTSCNKDLLYSWRRDRNKDQRQLSVGVLK